MIIGLDTRNSKSTEHKVQMLEDYIQRLRKELEHTLQNLDEKNINQFAKIKTAQIEKLIVGGNVTMGPDAYISWDNVTGDKPTQYTDALALEAINSTYIDANGVWTPNVYATNISALKGKIKTAQIEDLIVGGNVAMGHDATISWGQVTDAPSYIKSTYIDSTTVQSPTIIGGSITGGIVQTADTSYKRIVVDTSGITSYDGSYKNGFYAKSGTYSEGALGINHNGVSAMSMHWNGQGTGYLRCGGNFYIMSGISDYRMYFSGNLDFSLATIINSGELATRAWVSDNFASDVHSHAYVTFSALNTEINTAMTEHLNMYHAT